MVGVRRQNGTVQKLSKHHAKGTLQTVSTSDREVTCHSPANTATPESSLHPAAPRLFLEMQILNTWKSLYDTLDLHRTVSLEFKKMKEKDSQVSPLNRCLRNSSGLQGPVSQP